MVAAGAGAGETWPTLQHAAGRGCLRDAPAAPDASVTNRIGAQALSVSDVHSAQDAFYSQNSVCVALMARSHDRNIYIWTVNIFIPAFLSGCGRIVEDVLVRCFGSVELFVWTLVALDCVVSLCVTLAQAQGCDPPGIALLARPAAAAISKDCDACCHFHFARARRAGQGPVQVGCGGSALHRPMPLSLHTIDQ